MSGSDEKDCEKIKRECGIKPEPMEDECLGPQPSRSRRKRGIECDKPAVPRRKRMEVEAEPSAVRRSLRQRTITEAKEAASQL